jgi:hypothetical protein
VNKPAISDGALGLSALQWLGEMLRGRYLLPTTLPSGVYDLVTKLDRHDGRTNQPKGPDEQWPVPISCRGCPDLVPTSLAKMEPMRAVHV